MPKKAFANACDGLAYGVLIALLAWPGLGGLLRQTMSGHMLQLALLVALGFGLGRHLVKRWPLVAQAAERVRWTCLVSAVMTLLLWSIPRQLDLALESPWVEAAKVLSLVLFAGLALAFCWPNLTLPVRGVLHVEALASVWRMGWLYLESPSRLCTQYGLNEQQSLGKLLMAAGVAYALWLAYVALGGRALSPRLAL